MKNANFPTSSKGVTKLNLALYFINIQNKHTYIYRKLRSDW